MLGSASAATSLEIWHTRVPQDGSWLQPAVGDFAARRAKKEWREVLLYQNGLLRNEVSMSMQRVRAKCKRCVGKTSCLRGYQERG